ncbi:ribosome assembly factor SBDS [archaeon]|jgi:ribosome maturation protein SDO1|nr:ribosome assembly factor SBDS [archaeon]MBT4023127.1 ribosome assembly factor SBDS [archaeon]MBT4271870.1 ribosome assembly factor SBDS [archaeon]MBT4460758.1 ribosome assembly factor SBDS [archaeon]MBT4858827.1 ribosome assembly factor SBDS [archaeon]
MKSFKTFDKEKVSFNLAKLKKGGEMFEVIIDPDKILEFKKGKLKAKESVMYEKVFFDAKKGLEASSEIMNKVFNTENVVEVIDVILNDGEIQFTQEYREEKQKEKFNRILEIISRNAIDAKTGLPHPRNRIESAMEEARVKIDVFKDAEEQVDDIVHKLKPIIPIKLAMKEIQIKIPAQYTGTAYGVVSKYGKILMDNWLNDGSWLCSVEIPAGIQNDFFDALNRLTQGTVESKVLR